MQRTGYRVANVALNSRYREGSLLRSLIAGWRLSLRRTRADWPIVVAAWVITLLATTLLAAGPIYSSAAAVAGLRRTLADEPTSTVVQASVYGTPAIVAGTDSTVQAELRAAVAPLAAPILRDAQAASTLGLPAGPNTSSGDQAVVAFFDGVSDHARLVQGAWPAQGNPTGPMQAVVLDSVASQLQLGVGDQISLSAVSGGQATPVPVQLVGTFAIDDPADPFWSGNAQATKGITSYGAAHVYGPFLTSPEGLLGNSALSSVHMRWRVFPGFDGLTVDNIAAIRDNVQALPQRLRAASPTGATFGVGTTLPDALNAAERSLLVGRTEMLLLMAQLAIMAAYAIGLTASLLVDHRRVETSLLRSRGSGAGRIAWLALAEGLLLVVPSVLIAPWLALGAVNLLNVAGPLADIGLTLEPSVTSDSYLLAGVAGLICLALLVVTPFLAARNFASEERELSRAETRTFGQRLGLDITLLAISIIALWQLQLYGAPLTRTVQGSLGFDPLLVAAPAVGLLAGGVLALRILPHLAAVLERSVSRGKEVIGSLGSRQLARRPLRYTRTALLLILALALGVFAVSYAATWSTSQQDQASYQAGADVRASVSTAVQSTPPVAADYAAIPGVRSVMPVERINGGVTLKSGPAAVLLGVDSGAAGSVVQFRSDQSALPFDQLMSTLHAAVPTPQLATLPDDAGYLQVGTNVDVAQIISLPPSGPTSQPLPPLDPSNLTGVSVVADAIVRDGHGLLHRFSSPRAPVTGGQATAVIPIATKLDRPLELAGLELEVGLPDLTLTSDATIGATAVAAAASADGPWTDIPTSTGWAARMSTGGALPQPVAPVNVNGMQVHVGGDPNSFLRGGVLAGQIFLIPSSIDSLSGSTPVIANAAFAKALAASTGQTVDASIDGTQRHLQVAGVVDAFPTSDPTQPMLVFDEATLDLLRLQATSGVRNVDEWWLAVAPGTSGQVASTLRAEPFSSNDVVTADGRARSLTTDPVALGIIGALLLGFVATAVFALVALVASAAVSARQRRTEFALLRALGLSGSQLSRWLWFENGSVVLVSLIAGTIVGVVISSIALPFITVTQAAATPVPGVLIHLPWDRILLLDVIVLITLGVAVGVLAVVLRRTGVGSIMRLGED